MHLHQLRYFVAIVETGSVTKAAEKCFVSQPSISQQMSKLEDSLGHNFFDRSGGKQTLTDAGQLLYQQAKKVLESVDSTKKMMSDIKDSARGKIAIGINPAIGPAFLPDMLIHLSAKYPSAEIQVRESVSEVLQVACARGELDLVITSNPKLESSLVSEVLMKDPFYIAMNVNNPLAKRNHVNLEDIESEPFILLDDIHCLARQIESFCFDQRFVPKVLFQASQFATVKQLLQANYGVTILPQLAQDKANDGQIKYFKIENNHAFRQILLLKKTNDFTNQVTKDFIRMAREYCLAIV